MAASLKDPGSIPGGGPKRFHDSFNFVFHIVGECISCAADTHLATDLTCKFSFNYVQGNMKCLNIHLIQVSDQPPTAEVTQTSSTEATGCEEMKRIQRNRKNLTKEERERLVGAMQALIDRNRCI